MKSLFMQILDKKNAHTMQTNNADELKTNLKCFGIRNSPETSKDPLTNEEQDATKTPRSEKNHIKPRSRQRWRGHVNG